MSNLTKEQELIQSGQQAVTQALAAMTPEQREAVTVYQALVQQLGEKVAKKIAKPGTIGIRWETGAAYLDDQAPRVVEDVMRRFFGVMGLSEFVCFCAACAGYQAGVARAKGFDLPDQVFTEAGQIFEGGMRVIAVSSEVVTRSGLINMVPGLPNQGH